MTCQPCQPRLAIEKTGTRVEHEHEHATRVVNSSKRLARLAGWQVTMDMQTTFWSEARRAVRAGLLSQAEARLLARAGTRKAAYWARHLADLRSVVAQRAGAPGGQ